MHLRKTPEFYRFVSIYQGYMAESRDYGDGVMRTMSEAHILQIICCEPGITVGQVAQRWGKTKSAASMNITKLEKQGLVYRTKHEENAKEIHVYPTDAGMQVTELHEAYDQRTEEWFTKELLKRCSMEDLQTFDRVLSIYSDLMELDLEE